MIQRHLARRHGIAMLQVILATGSATVLTTAYMASRDNSPVIATNVSSAAASRVGADSGIAMAEAILQTLGDWRTLHDEGLLLDEYQFGDITLSLQVVDMITGLPPNADSREIGLISSATVNGVTQEVTASASVMPTGIAGGATVDLSEFAVFGADRILLQNNATITRWSSAPLASDGRRLVIGTQGTMIGTVNISGDAAAVDTTLYHGPHASSLIALNAGPAIQRIGLSEHLPFPDAPPTGIGVGGLVGALELDGSSQSLSADARYSNLSLATGSTLTLAGPLSLVVNDAMSLSNSTIRIRGDVKIVVLGDVDMNDSVIKLDQDDATLEIFAGRDFDMDDSYVGDEPEGGTWTNSGSDTWMDPNRVSLFGLDSTTDIKLGNNSVLKGIVYAPSTAFAAQGTSAVYGRVAAQTVALAGDAAIFYDHTLDGLNGYTNAESPLFDNGGSVLEAVVSLASLSTADLQSVAANSGFDLMAFGRTIDDGSDVPDAVLPPITAPTPRPVSVNYQVRTYGTAFSNWEQRGVNQGHEFDLGDLIAGAK